MRPLRYLATLLLAVCLLSPASRASSATGSILGTVTDQTGAVIVGAAVELRNQATGTTRTNRTDESGSYHFVLLQPGVYDVSVKLQGFKEGTYEGIKVDVDQVLRANLSLQVAGAKEEVSVAGEVPLVNTETSSVGQVVQRGFIANLPLNERNYQTFTLLVPGAHTPVAGSQASTMGSGSVSVNGAREQANTYLLDGVDNNSLLINRTTVSPPLDAIEEFKVQSSTASAEYGRSAGSQINLILKSGTNAFHGSLFEYFRNRLLDAKNYFDLPACTPNSVQGTCGPIPRFQRNQFGGTFGGPIKQNKAFFFVAYEGLNLRQATTREATVPSQNERTALLAAIPPALQSPAGLATLNLYPAANVGSDLANSTLYTAAPVITETLNTGSVRLDDQLTPRDELSGHYAIYDDNRYNPYDVGFTVSNLPGFGDNHISRGQNIGITWTHSFNQNLYNELHFGYNRDRLAVFQQNQGTNYSAQLGYPFPPKPLDWGYPNAQITGYDTLGEPFQAPEDNVVNTFHIADNLAWTPAFDGGRHQLKFGGDFRRYQDGSGNTNVNLRSFSEAFYGLDNFRVTRNLTLNLGLRYEYNSAPVDTNNHLSIANTSPDSITCTPKPACQFTVAGTNGLSRGTYTTNKTDFAPRIGFSWSVFPNGAMVLRGGYGIYWDVSILDVSLLLADNPPFYKLLYNVNDGMNNIQTIITSPINYIISFRVAPNYHDAYLKQWNLGTQFQLTPSLVFEMGYVGSKGTHLIGFSDNNQSMPGGLMPYPEFGSIATMDSSRSSTYNSLQVRAEQRLWHKTSFLAAYTWSKSIDNGSEFLGSSTEGQYAQDYYNLAGERGLSAFDARQRFVASFLTTLPFGPGARFVNTSNFAGQLLRDWQFSAIAAFQSGQPFTINRSVYQSYTSLIIGTDRPDLIADPLQPGPVMANPDPACHETISQGGLAADHTHTVQTWINPCAYSNPNLLGQFRFGTSPRNQVIGPGLAQVDVSLNRSFPLSERVNLNARADVFNVFNHPNFDPPIRIFDSQNFGSLFSANAFGTRPPRQIQFALKLLF